MLLSRARSCSLAETSDFLQFRIIITAGVELVAKPWNRNDAVDNLAGNDEKQSRDVQRIASNAIQRINHFIIQLSYTVRIPIF